MPISKWGFREHRYSECHILRAGWREFCAHFLYFSSDLEKQWVQLKHKTIYWQAVSFWKNNRRVKNHIYTRNVNKFYTQFQHLLLFLYYYYYCYRHHHHHHHLLYAGYLYLYSWDKLCPYGVQYCSYSVVTIHGAYIVSFSVESIVLLH